MGWGIWLWGQGGCCSLVTGAVLGGGGAQDVPPCGRPREQRTVQPRAQDSHHFLKLQVGPVAPGVTDIALGVWLEGVGRMLLPDH